MEIKSKQIIILFIIILVGVVVGNLVSASFERIAQKKSRDEQMSHLYQVLNADQEELNRRLEEYNETVAQLYALLSLLEDYDGNQAAIRRIYNGHLKYVFLFTPQEIVLNQMLLTNQEAPEYQKMVALKEQYLQAERDGRQLASFQTALSGNAFFVNQVDLQTFERLNPSAGQITQLRNQTMEYIKHLEVYFLSLQAVNAALEESIKMINDNYEPDQPALSDEGSTAADSLE